MSIPTDIAPEVTAFLADARERATGPKAFMGDPDSQGILDVLLDYFAEVHVGAVMGLDDIVSLAADVQRVGRYLEVLARDHRDALDYEDDGEWSEWEREKAMKEQLGE